MRCNVCRAWIDVGQYPLIFCGDAGPCSACYDSLRGYLARAERSGIDVLGNCALRMEWVAKRVRQVERERVERRAMSLRRRGKPRDYVNPEPVDPLSRRWRAAHLREADAMAKATGMSITRVLMMVGGSLRREHARIMDHLRARPRLP